MLRERITRMSLKDGDGLLIQGRPEDVDRLRCERDVVLMEWSRQPLVTPQHRRVATVVFLPVVAPSTFNLLAISLAAFSGSTPIIPPGLLTFRDSHTVPAHLQTPYRSKRQSTKPAHPI